MSSKYLNLPDVDTSAPDVYESADPLGPSEANDPYGSGDDLFPIAGSSKQAHTVADIDGSHLPRRDVVAGSFGRRKGGAATYSYRPPRLRLPTPTHRPSRAHAIGSGPSSPSSSDDESHETPQARLRRLKWEMEELERDLKSGAQEPRRKEPSAEDMLDQLAGLRTGVSGLEGKMGEGAGAASALEPSIEEQLEALGKVSAKPAANIPDPFTATDPAAPVTSQQATSDLDKRLEVIERAVGAGSGLDDSSALPPAILPTLSRLEQLVAILSQPRQLDAISRRVKLLLADLDKAAAISAKRANAADAVLEDGAITAAEREKLDALFGLLPRMDPLLPVVPPVLDRLRSLSALHASAAGWDSTLRKLEASADELDVEDGDLEEVVKRVEEAITREGEAVKENWKSLSERLGDVERRLQAAQGA